MFDFGRCWRVAGFFAHSQCGSYNALAYPTGGPLYSRMGIDGWCCRHWCASTAVHSPNKAYVLILARNCFQADFA